MIPAAPIYTAPTKEATGKDKKTNEELSSQMASLNDKYLRLMADFDNHKRRGARENERLIEAANELLMKDIIEVMDNFERAFKSNDRGDKFFHGISLNNAKLHAILKKHGLEGYAEPGDEFDPELHDALMRVPHESIPNSHIIDVVERGYELKGKIIKHAKVVVSSGKPEIKSKKQPPGNKC
jgi:molecular chaperone GrpE